VRFTQIEQGASHGAHVDKQDQKREFVVRRLILSSALLAVVALGATSASANAATTETCENNASVKLSPGLSNTPTVQNISVKGTLTNCTGEEATVTSGKYVAHLKTSEPVTCAVLAGSGAATGTVVLKWTPKGHGNSLGSFSMALTELPTEIGGLIESGPFAESPLGGTVTQTYTGGSTCGVAEGKKKAKKVNKGTLTGTLTV
jgi:hypothetical protein